MVIDQRKGQKLELHRHILVPQINILRHAEIDRREIEDRLDAPLDDVIHDILRDRRRHRQHHHLDLGVPKFRLRVADIRNNDPLVVGADLPLVVVE